MGDDAQLLRLLLELREQEQPTLAAARRHGGAQRLQPLTGLFGVGIRRGRHHGAGFYRAAPFHS